MNRSMLTKQTTIFFEKILTDRRGISVRVTFAVICTAGVRDIRILSATPILALRGHNISSAQIALPSSSGTTDTVGAVQSERSVPSPYFSTIELFFTSQMTRAPATALPPIA